ncbi:hypothetical protein TWF694_007343 [Orbilia ellipsospora]|uniref:Uncharacterized protein n=1 Tax=Orbilia ellipsospora TaxID=2528407 RepID=A0AAV9XJ34_9PEZI
MTSSDQTQARVAHSEDEQAFQIYLDSDEAPRNHPPPAPPSPTPPGFIHPYMNRLILPVNHPDFDPRIHDPLRLPREQFDNLFGVPRPPPVWNQANRENGQNEEGARHSGRRTNTTHHREHPTHFVQQNPADFEFQPTDFEVNPGDDTRDFQLLLPVDHPLFDPFVHDTLLWPRRDVVEAEWEEERRMRAAPRQLDPPFEYHPQISHDLEDQFRPRRLDRQLFPTPNPPTRPIQRPHRRPRRENNQERRILSVQEIEHRIRRERTHEQDRGA